MLGKSTLASSAAHGLPLAWTTHIFTAAAGEIAVASTGAGTGAAAAAGHNSNLQFSMLIRLILRARCRSDDARRRRPFWRSTKECYKLCSTAWQGVQVCVCVCGTQGTCAGGSISNGGSCKRHKRVWCREHAPFAFGMTLEGVKRSFLYGASCCSLHALLLLGQPFGKYMLLWPCVIMRTSGPSRMGSNRAPPATHPTPAHLRVASLCVKTVWRVLWPGCRQFGCFDCGLQPLGIVMVAIKIGKSHHEYTRAHTHCCT